ncbi:MAG: hypothetical protein DRP20_01220 [Thermotogae bacterium]|nr:MAG: hypothetical protein DRP20_01220 [Thermotogota bacterium]
MKKLLTLISLMLVLFCVGIFAYQWEEFPGFFKPFESLAMGGVYTTTAQGLSALVLNPALYEPQGFEMFFYPFVSNNLFSVGSVASQLISNPASLTELASNTELLNSMLGIHSYTMLSGAGYGDNIGDVSVGGFGALQGSVFWNISLDSLDSAELGTWLAYYGIVGASMEFDNLSFGASVGVGMNGSVIPTTGSYPLTVDLLSDPEGALDSIPSDFSNILASVNKAFFVTSIGAAYDIGSLRLAGSLFVNTAELLRNTQLYWLTVGASYNWNILTVAVELEDVLNQSKSLWRKLNMGASVDWDFLELYGGLHAGWLTGGIALDMKFVKIGFASYVTEYSSYAGFTPEQKYTITINGNF